MMRILVFLCRARCWQYFTFLFHFYWYFVVVSKVTRKVTYDLAACTMTLRATQSFLNMEWSSGSVCQSCLHTQHESECQYSQVSCMKEPGQLCFCLRAWVRFHSSKQAGRLGPNNNTKLHATPSDLQQNRPLPDARTHTFKVLPHEAHWRRRRNAVADGARILHCVFPDSLEVSFLIAHLSSTLLRQGHPHSLQDPVSSAFWSHRNTVTVLLSKDKVRGKIVTHQT